MLSANERLRAAVREARQRAGISQVTLAVRAGLSLSTVRLVEVAGIATTRTLAGLSRALGLPLEALRPRGDK